VAAPGNLAVIRSRQVFGDLQGEERTLYHERIEPALRDGMDYLARNAGETGCLACRLLRETDAQGQAVMAEAESVALNRATLLEVLRRTLADNPHLLSTFIGLEPNAVDAQDAQQVGKLGHSAQGRFLPVWLRSPSGTLELADMHGMESEKRGLEGVREGDFYLCPKARGTLCVLDPIGYSVNDKVVLLPVLSAPIIVAKQFLGVAGASPSIEFIQSLATRTSGQLFAGAAKVAIFASNRHLIAYSADPTLINQPAAQLLDQHSQAVLAGLQQEPVYQVDHGRDLIELFMPFDIGDPQTRWTLMIQIPRSPAGFDGY
jgi:methyl-accepting chemotaxis protein